MARALVSQSVDLDFIPLSSHIKTQNGCHGGILGPCPPNQWLCPPKRELCPPKCCLCPHQSAVCAPYHEKTCVKLRQILKILRQRLFFGLHFRIHWKKSENTEILRQRPFFWFSLPRFPLCPTRRRPCPRLIIVSRKEDLFLVFI